MSSSGVDRLGRALAGIAGSNPTVGVDVFRDCVSWVINLSVALITRPEECYRV